MNLQVLLLASHVVLGFGAVILPLNGNDWTLSGSDNITVAAQVPGGVYTDLIRSKKIGDPYFRMNDVSYRWVALSNWTYTKTFQVDALFLKHQRIELVAGGLDTVATVYINDVVVLQAANMFTRYIANVTSVLKVGSNVIRVVFLSPITYAQQQAKSYPYDVPPDCPTAVQHGECHFNFIRKEACSFSWDWGPSFPSMGIWKNITLEAYDVSVIRYVMSDTMFDKDESIWYLTVAVDYDVNSSSASPVAGLLTVSVPELNIFESRKLLMMKGRFRESVAVQLTNVVEKWWPNGLGQQKLYAVHAALSNSFGDVDKKNISVAFRTVELVEDVVGGEESGYTFYFRVNGVPVFIKGSNWIPADSFQERITTTYLEKLLTSAVEANMNMLRVWGGGVYESEEFYSLTDRLGIMIWQDFMFACALYPVNDDFITNVAQEVTHQVRRLKRHPSIAIWSGNNENEGALANNWFGVSPTQSTQFRADYIKLYVDTIRNIVMSEDPTRPFVTSSPSNGRDTIEEGFIAKDPQSIRYGDVHYYTYEDDTWNWRTFPMPRFASEFGIQSWCSMETLRPVSLPVDWDMDSDFVWHRQHHDQGNIQIQDEIAMHMHLPTSVNRTKKFIDFIYLSQINQAVGIQTEVEFYRRSQNLQSDGQGLTMGALYWQLNDIWQGPTWASIEYGGKWKMLHYFAKRFYSRRIVSPYIEDGLVKVYYINDDVWTSNPNLQHEPEDFKLKFEHGMQDKEIKSPGGVVHMQNTGQRPSSEKVLKIDCYQWNSLEQKKSWKIRFDEPKLAAKCIYMSRVDDLMSECGCQHMSQCFFYFREIEAGGSETFPNSYLFLTNLSSAVGLERANVQVTQLYPVNSTLARIVVSTDGIAPFTWLEAVGFEGHFSDNGFLMVTYETVVTFTAWEPIYDWDKFMKTLTVRTYLDAYVD